MKHFIVLLLLTSFFSYGQIKDDVVIYNHYYYLPGDTKKYHIEYVVKGTPYLDKLFKIGTVSFNTKNEVKSLMRYNIFRDYFELLDKDQKQTILQKKHTIEVILEKKTYQFIEYLNKGETKTGYLTPLSSGKTVLYSKINKKMSEYSSPDNGYQTFSSPKFIDEFDYYIKKFNEPAKKVKLNKKDVLFNIEDKFTVLKAHVKENKLRLKTEEEVIQLLAYYDSLEKN